MCPVVGDFARGKSNSQVECFHPEAVEDMVSQAKANQIEAKSVDNPANNQN